MSTRVDEYFRIDGPSRGVRDDWEVRSGPDGVLVTAWTHDRFLHPEQAAHAAERVLRDILALGYRVSGPCETDAQRDVDGDWRGHLVAQLEPPAPSTSPTVPSSGQSLA
ncbi:MAG: hypothetical protein QM747_06580 [Nocardioides sp.]